MHRSLLIARRDAVSVEHFVDRHRIWLYELEELAEALGVAGFEQVHVLSEGLMPGRGLLTARRLP